MFDVVVSRGMAGEVLRADDDEECLRVSGEPIVVALDEILFKF